MFLDLGRNTFLVELVLLKATSVGQSWGIEDANLEKRLCKFTMLTNSGTYRYAVLARKFVNARGIGLTLVGRTALLVGMVKNIKVIMTSVISSQNIGY